MMAEWDRFGDEEEEAFRAARRRKMIIWGLGGVSAVVVVAGSLWVWSSTRGMPPYEPRSTALPRASIPATGSPTDSAAAAVTDTATPDTTAAAAVATGPDSTLAPDSAAAPATQPPSPTPARAAAPAATPSSRAAVPETRAPHQRFSWSMAALGTMDAARSTVERLRRRAPGQAFIVAPIVSDGRTLYRVLGGLAADREALAAIREPLGQATREQAGSWLVREAPLAFALQDFDDAAGAAAWVSELGRSGVPAYVLVVERDDGSAVHRVYAGAYANEAEAATLRGLLERAGIQDAKLVERRGRVGS
jgi:cell division septation protein DedD